MFKELKVNTPSLAGGTELTVLAPLKPGFVPSLDAVTYKTRAKMLLKALHSGRRGSHEHQLFRALSDAVERVGVIHTVRVAVIEPEDKIFLSVNFDGAYEAYVRVIWQKSARLLDLIFCNTVGHVTGWDHSYEAWRAWLRSVQVEVPFFYAPPGLTAPDQTHLRMQERFANRDARAELAITRIAVPDAEHITWGTIRRSVDPTNGPYGGQGKGLAGTKAGIRQGLQALVGLYRLADVYPPGTRDGVVLHRAARELVPEFARMQAITAQYGATIVDVASGRVDEALDWLRRDVEGALDGRLPQPLPPERQAPPLPATDPLAAPDFPADQVQAGIVRPYAATDHGGLCLLAFDDAAAAAAFLARFAPRLTTAAQTPAPGSLVWNIGFTADGLVACGLDEPQMDWFPDEFRQGMAARAGLLGDVRGNHPRRWKLPERNFAHEVLGQPAPAQPRAVPLETVHAVVQLRWVTDPAVAQPRQPGAARQAMVQGLRALVEGLPAGVRPLSVQWMARQPVAPAADGGPAAPVEHFGFADGLSQPQFAPQQPPFAYNNQVHLGEVLVGWPNAADREVDLAADRSGARGRLKLHGSFQVVRKLRQRVGLLRRAVDDAGQPLPRALVLGKMMGRWPAWDDPQGRPLAPASPGQPNDFSYRTDPTGAQCPFAAHIRRSNPRVAPVLQSTTANTVLDVPGARPPRLMRRGMSYGPPAPAWTDARVDDAAAQAIDSIDRGLVFMAYNASLGEQFEVVQRWLSGGNSAGASSSQSDPFLGVPEAGRRRFYRFEHDGKTYRVALDGSDELGDEPEGLVELQWGLYLFAPSVDGLASLRESAERRGRQPLVAWQAVDGERLIQQLRRIEAELGPEVGAQAWKAMLEDPGAVARWDSASIWAAIRANHGGLLRIPYGVLVADRALVDEVLLDPGWRYSVAGYQRRLAPSIGPIYLGLDDRDDGAYRQQSAVCNAAIQAIDVDEAFQLARDRTDARLSEFIQRARDVAARYGDPRWELTLDVRELVDEVLADLTEAWFGLSEEGGHFERGGFRWHGDVGGKPRYPGWFMSPSRFTFQPAPGPTAEAVALRQGPLLRAAMVGWLGALRSSTVDPVPGTVTRAVLDGTSDLDLAARTLVGALMGFLPPAAGNLRRVASEWLSDGTLWALRAGFEPAATAALQRACVTPPLMRAMQARPVPELIWRTATRLHALGEGRHALTLAPDDMVILALVSATQQGLATGSEPDVYPVFGGRRDTTPAPTHACPAYGAAMGALAGFFHAILARPETLRPGPSATVLAFEGPIVQAPAAQDGASARVVTSRAPAERAKRTPARGTLLAIGDSWISNWHPVTSDLADGLQVLGYDTRAFVDLASEGACLRELAAVPFDASVEGTIYARLHDAILAAREQPALWPRAVLVSGGGNDLHTVDDAATGASPLSRMLNPRGSGLPPIRQDALDRFLQQRLVPDLRTLLDRLLQLTALTGHRIPIVLHGYDFPVPDGRHYTGDPLKAWLYPPIVHQAGYTDPDEARGIMRTLITALNAAQRQVVAGYPADRRVRHVDLTGTLRPRPGQPDDYKRWWENELHPTPAGFALLARRLDAAIQALWQPPVPGTSP